MSEGLDRGVTELGYLGFGVSDIAAWKDFAAGVLGLEVAPGDNPRSCTFRMDSWSQRFLVTENGADDLDLVGWRVASAESLDRIRVRLRKAGVHHEVASPQQAEDRQVLGLLTLQDPSGLATEIFYGPRIEPGEPFYPGRRMHGPFVTGEGGLGHVVTDVANPQQCEDFYVRLLGMRGSVEFQMQWPGKRKPRRLGMHFLSCNARQHSLAFGNFAGGKRLSHVMTELARLEDVGLTRDIVKARGLPIRLDIGQHHNDRAVSFYLVTPSGWNWECGWGVVSPSGQAEWGRSAIWGHEFLPSQPASSGRSTDRRETT